MAMGKQGEGTPDCSLCGRAAGSVPSELDSAKGGAGIGPDGAVALAPAEGFFAHAE